MAQFEFETANDEFHLVRGQCSLVLDGNGEPRIAYSLETGELVVASRIAGTWVHETLGGPFIAPGTEDRDWLRVSSKRGRLARAGRRG